MRRTKIATIVFGIAIVSVPLHAQVSVTTRSYDASRTGANTHETALKPAGVANVKFLRELKIDADDDPRIEAQPLYFPGVASGGQNHDLVIVCTMADNVYAFDVKTGARLWKQPLGTPVKPAKKGGLTPAGLQPTEIDMYGTNIRWGILSTPVIDSDTKTLYVVAWSSTTPDGSMQNGQFRLHALKLGDGTDAHAPLTITASANGANFTPSMQKQRSALLLIRAPASGGGSRKTLIMAGGLNKELAVTGHGWVLAFDLQDFRRTAAWIPTPASHGGGIWQAGHGPAGDDQGFIYFITSNGGKQNQPEFAESLVKLRYTPPTTANGPGTLAPVGFFSPFDDLKRNAATRDEDLGSGGVVLPTGNLMVGSGKDGVLYVVDRNNPGMQRVNQAHTNVADYAPSLKAALFFTYFPGFGPNPLKIADLDMLAAGQTHHLHGAPVAWTSDTKGTMLFVWGENSPLRSWTLAPSGAVQFVAESQETASAFSARPDAMPGGMLTLSANGGKDGIVWGIVPVKGNWNGHANEGDANKEVVEGILRAYDATALNPTPNPNGNARMKLLWESTTPGNPRPGDKRFTYDKFCPPVVADGRVLVPTYEGSVLVYGL